MIDDKVREAERLSGEPFPKQLVLEIKHMVISHHGEYEYGSPKLPMTLEAVALHHLDNLDAKLASFTQLMIDCPNVESNWTQYHTNLGRKLYKGDVPGCPEETRSPFMPPQLTSLFKSHDSLIVS
jgi:3'-5' exoribonuclease